MNNYIVLFIWLTGMLLVGCTSSRSSPALSMPVAAEVTRVIVREGASTSERSITESDRIAALLTFLATHNSDWHEATSTFPTPRITVSAYDHDRLVITIFVGAGWMGGRNGDQYASDNRLRDLSDDDQRQLETLLRP